MTAPAMSLAEQCEAILESTRMREQQMAAARRAQPVIKLMDGHFNLRHVVRVEDAFEVQDPENDTGPGTLRLSAEFDEAQWLWDVWGRREAGETINVWLVVEYVGRRWSGGLHEVDMDTDELGNSIVESTFLSDYEQLKWRDLWATPTTPAAFQPIKVHMLGGPVPWALGTSLWLNLARAHGWPTVSLDPLSATTADYRDWPIVIKPQSFGQAAATGVLWGIVLSRFKDWHEAAEVMLADAEQTLRWRRWFDGDPLPWEGARISHGTLVVWFEDNSTLDEGTFAEGGLFSGLVRLVRTFVNDFVEDTQAELTGLPVIPEYELPGHRGTDPRAPFVFYPRNAPGMVGQKSRVTLARGLRFTTGGHSMPGVNELMSAAVQAIGDALAAIPGGFIPPLGGVADAVLKPFYEDTVLAFMSVWMLHRAGYMSPFSLYEMFIEGSDKAYTLASLAVFRAGVRATMTTYTASAEIVDGLPWWVGAPGHGDFDLGNRILYQATADTSERILSERVQLLTLRGERGTHPEWAITLGRKDAGDPLDMILDNLKTLASGVKQLGLV